ncbi:CHAT domain-containing protein [Antrihabitans spumae]|uniref:CHAT domain-containing protein n=1 Tax=Antrihabitans spumae TaxID=3373370 RepID=A0ABW7KK20_9NOCA
MAEPDRNDAVANWLAQRNLIPFEDRYRLRDLVIAAITEPTQVGAVLVGIIRDRQVVRENRTVRPSARHPGRIGEHMPDVFAINAAINFTAVRHRSMVVAASIAVGWALGWPMMQVVLIGAATFCFGLSKNGLANAIAVLFGVAAIAVHWHDWLAVIGLLFVAYGALLIQASPVRTGLFVPTPYAAAVMPSLARLAHPRRWSVVSIAVESAFAQDPHVALRFIELAEKPQAAELSAVLAAKAVALARVRQVTQALVVLQMAREGGLGSSRIKAIVHLAAGEVLLAAGRSDESMSEFHLAATAARGRAGRPVVTHARRRMVNVLVDRGEWAQARDQLLILRADALGRRREGYDLNWTELVLIRMMLQVGNMEGIRRSALFSLKADNRQTALGWTPDDHIAAHLLLAACAIEDDRPEDADREVRQAMARLADHPNVAMTTHAYYVWTLAGLGQDVSVDELLSRIFGAVREGERLRFRLPASVWRNDWAGSMEHVYGLALEVAAEADDPLAVVEVIEVVRAQPVPARRDERDGNGSAARRLLEAALSVRSKDVYAAVENESDSHTAIAFRAALGADLLEPPPALRIGGSSWAGPPEFPAIDIETCLASFAFEAVWYLGGAVLDGILWVSVREPSGGWSFVRRDLSGADGAALAALLDVLPDVATMSTAEGAYRDRVLRKVTTSPLWRPHSRRPRSVEIRLLQPIADLLLPPRLQRALASAGSRRVVIVTGFVGVLTAIPLAGLPVPGAWSNAGDELRIIEAADLIHPPPWAEVHANIRLSAKYVDRAEGLVAPLRLAVVTPDPAADALLDAVAPPGAERVLFGRVERRELAAALHAIDRVALSTVLFTCHGVGGSAGQPATGGLRFADGVLEVRDLLTFSGSEPRYPMPDRVIVSACESLGADAGAVRPDPATDREPQFDIRASPEWIGFPIGCLAAGARHVIATRYCLSSEAETNVIDHMLVDRCTTSFRPWTVVGDMQRERLGAARGGEKVKPLIWQSFSYYGFGAGILRETT